MRSWHVQGENVSYQATALGLCYWKLLHAELPQTSIYTWISSLPGLYVGTKAVTHSCEYTLMYMQRMAQSKEMQKLTLLVLLHMYLYHSERHILKDQLNQPSSYTCLCGKMVYFFHSQKNTYLPSSDVPDPLPKR